MAESALRDIFQIRPAQQNRETPYIDLLKQHKEKDFVNRILNPSIAPAGIPWEGGSVATHQMAAEVDENGNWYVFPTIVNQGGKLVSMPLYDAFDYARETGEYIPMPDMDSAINFSENYKTKAMQDWFTRPVYRPQPQQQPSNPSALRALVPRPQEIVAPARSWNPLNPAFRDTLSSAMTNMLGASNVAGREGYDRSRYADMLTGAVDFVPGAGEAAGVGDVRREVQQGNYPGAALAGVATALGVIPVIGDVAGKAVRGAGNALDMSQAARMQRAQEMGLDSQTRLYHGTGDDIQEFDLNIARDVEGRKKNLGLGSGKIYLHGDPGSASAFALRAKERGLGRNPNVMPLYSTGNYIDEDEYKKLFMKNSNGVEITSKDLTKKKRDALILATDNQVKDMGFDGIAEKYKSRDGSVIGYGQVAVFDPKNIRSVNAAFDPAKRNSTNLMAGVGGVLAGGSALRALLPQEQERQPD